MRSLLRGGTLVLLITACSDPEVQDLGPADLGFDAGSPDLGPSDLGFDAGTPDLGPDDLGPEDIGPMVGCISVEPQGSLLIPEDEPREVSFTIENSCAGALSISGINILGPGAEPGHPSADDFMVNRCSITPCAPSVLCSPFTPGCTTSSMEVTISYANNDASMGDLAELIILSDDPQQPQVTIPLEAEFDPCRPPTGLITIQTIPSCLNAPVTVDGLLSTAGGLQGGGSSLVDYQWSWIFAQGTMPAFSDQGQATTSFVPVIDGNHVLRLIVTNDCGASSEEAMVSVRVERCI